MSELKYDSEFPYVLVNVNGEEHTRWANKKLAEHFLQKEWEGYGRVIDTTPKPKIPADAQHITWGTQTLAYSRYIDDLWYGWNHGHGLSDEELLGMIGNAEVTVLVRKGES